MSNVGERNVKMFSFLQKYQCLADKCTNTCCKGWTIDVDRETIKKWIKTAPELINHMEERKNNPHHYKMKMTQGLSDKSFYCNLYDGKCKIHSKFGVEALPNTCSAYPFLYRGFFNNIFATATASCSAIVYLAMDDNENENFKIIDANHTIRRDEETISSHLDYLMSNQIDANLLKIDIANVISSVFHDLMNGIDKCTSIKQVLARFLNLCINFDDKNINEIISGSDKILRDGFLNIEYKDIFAMSNIKIRPFYKNLLISVANVAFHNDTELGKVIKSMIESCLADDVEVEEAYHKYKGDEEMQSLYFKYLRRFFKAKMAENIFPFGVRYQSFKNIGMAIVVEIVIIELLFALFYAKNLLNVSTAIEIVHIFERDMYGKSEKRVMNIIADCNLDKLENIFCCLME